MSSINIDAVRAILKSYEIGERLNDRDYKIMFRVLEQHPKAREKIGSGVAFFMVGNGEYGGRCFYVGRLDGSMADFSFLKCFGKKVDRFNAAARRAIEPSIALFRRRLPAKFSCPISSVALTPYTCHIDHAPPNTFRQIVRKFIKEYSIDTSEVEYKLSGIGSAFIDANLAAQFVAFHDSIAQLRAISKAANLALPKL